MLTMTAKNPARGIKSTGDGQPEKASIWNEDTKPEAVEVIKFLFNPTTFSINKSVGWKAEPTEGKDVPLSMFSGGSPATLTIGDLLFDTYTMEPSGGGSTSRFSPSVRTYTDKIVSLMNVDENLKDPKSQLSRPPRVTFRWGTWTSFKAVITSVNQQFTLFAADGTAVRAKLTVTLQEIQEIGEHPPTNPTSYAEAHRVHTVRPGETIDGIAYQAFGDARKWPLIADFNRLDNPMRLTPGQRLGIPNLR